MVISCTFLPRPPHRCPAGCYAGWPPSPPGASLPVVAPPAPSRPPASPCEPPRAAPTTRPSSPSPNLWPPCSPAPACRPPALRQPPRLMARRPWVAAGEEGWQEWESVAVWDPPCRWWRGGLWRGHRCGRGWRRCRSTTAPRCPGRASRWPTEPIHTGCTRGARCPDPTAS